jgi:phage shock protein A
MAQKLTRLESLKSGDGGGTFEDMEHRVAFLEKAFEKMDAKLDIIIGDSARLREQVAYLQGKIETLPTAESLATLSRSLGELTGHAHTLPSAAAFGELKARVDSLPTTAKLASLLGLAVGAIAIINNWQVVKLFILGS